MSALYPRTLTLTLTLNPNPNPNPNPNQARLREENARLVAQLDATPEDLEEFSP